jgi:eukaryotic-like serine/threonine-protein kinase
LLERRFMNASKFPTQRGDEENFNRAVPVDAAQVFAPESQTFSPQDYAVGRVISGRFRVEHVIGSGSMGIVLAARHLELDERVAIKLIRAEMQRVPGVLQRFAREAKAAVSIKSDHVAQVFDVGTADGIGPYIVMEYLEGCDLAQVLELEGRLPIRRAVHYIMQACEALAVAHSAGITHRDIKPENLFLTRQGDLERIKLLDFGISKATLTGKVFGDELSAAESSCLLGTPLYMSPEQIRATSEVDHRADIWSLGAVLYELVTAHSAFVADSVHKVWTRILETTPTPLAAHAAEATPALQEVIDRCLEKDPARRFQSVAELANALSPFAPSRARLYAQRASSILGTRSDSAWPAPISSSPPAIGASSSPLAPPSPSGSSGLAPAVLPRTSLLALPDLSAPPVFRPHSGQPLAEPRGRGLMAATAVAALLGALFVIWLGSRRFEPTATPAEPRGAHRASASEPAAPASELLGSRTVLVESQPSGAVVSVGGQVLGVTPLSTLLPVGTQQLSLAKQGYADEQAFVQLDPAPAGAKSVRTRVLMRERSATEARPSSPSAQAAKAIGGPAVELARVARPAPRRALPRRPEPPRLPAASSEAAAPSPAPAPRAHSAPLVDEHRVRLLDERPRARIVE